MRIGEYLLRLRDRLGREPAVGFLGVGVSNLAILSDMPPTRTVIRSRDAVDIARLPSHIKDIRLYEGESALADIHEDLLLLSPSVRRDVPELVRAAERGCILISDAELYFLDAPYSIYAVTGSDGKSTTATLIHRLLLEAHPDCELIGNIGTPFATAHSGCAVAELSSFQLSYLKPRVRVGVITPVSPNHLNWHRDLNEYVEAKFNILVNAERRVLTPDTPYSASLADRAEPDAIYSATFTEEELRRRYSAEHYVTLDGESIHIDGCEILRLSVLKRREKHNVHNLMGAIAATLGECTDEHIRTVAASFSGLEHRMEYFLSAGGISFINSSIDTSPSRTAATLASLDKPVRLILGGRGKGLSLLPALPLIARYAERISLYGEAGEEYFRELSGFGISAGTRCERFERFDDATEHALAGISAGDTILLSPAATGYGEFRDFAERGRHFKQYIREKYKTHICERTEK